MKLVKFYKTIIPALGDRLNDYHDGDAVIYREVEKIINRLRNADGYALNERVMSTLRKLKDFNLDAYIYCYPYTGELDNYIKLKAVFFDEIKKLRRTQSEDVQIKLDDALTEQFAVILPTVKFRRLEYVLNRDFTGYIDKSGIPYSRIKDELLMTGEDESETVYQILRRLSNVNDCGYRFSKLEKVFTLEKKNKKELEFFWSNGGIYYQNERICELFYDVDVMAKLINRFYMKKQYDFAEKC